jgi:Mrp family chromosome partitioning ATPase
MGEVDDELRRAARDGGRSEASTSRSYSSAPPQPHASSNRVDVITPLAENGAQTFPDLATLFGSIPAELKTLSGEPVPIWARVIIELPDDEFEGRKANRPMQPERTSVRAPMRVEPLPAQADVAADLVPSLRANRKLIVAGAADPEFVREFERAADILLSRRLEAPLKTILVSSAVPGEGRTLAVANLALTLSERREQRVLVIDADFTAPGIHDAFGIANDRGLREALNTSEPVRFSSVSRRLQVLTAGNTQGAVLDSLVSTGFRDVLADAGRRFDWILIDSPPVSVQTDAHLLAWLTDGVVLVVARGTQRRAVSDTVREFGADRCVGMIFNRSV